MNQGDRAFLGHPRGLAYLLFTEAWERFSYYGMQSLLALYLVKHLLQPGQADGLLFFDAFRQLYGGLDGQPLASAIVGTYFASVYVTPILGGLVADRLLGRHRTVLLGALTMMAGHFLMAVQAAFLPALGLLVLGSGLFKGNLASQIGALYGRDDPRRDGAFQLYYLGINIGLIAAPLVIGTLAETRGWHVGFAVAGVGMAIATIIYLAGRRHLPVDERGSRSERRMRMTGQDLRGLLGIILLIPLLAVALLPNNQIFNAYLIWGDAHLELTLGGLRVPTSWLITLDAGLGLTILAGLPFVYRRYARHRPEPGDLAKLTIGSLFATGGMLCLALGSALAGA
ncbi:MFS transporter, partial [Sphingobium sp. IP1]|uniref:peptide MFS transporter n=1 Tax=Sphingobium sp. IP1 TaxID=2021637 RepID=UPI000C08334C